MNAFQKVKVAVSIEDYARTLTELKPEGLRLVGRCPIPGHNDRTPSFHVYTGNDSWHCFGACARGGDVIDLCQAVEGGEPWEAMMTLATRYDIKLPERPPKWYAWQETKTAIRNAAAEARRVVRRERFFKLLVLSGPEFDIEDPEERRAAIERAWRVWEAETRTIWL